MLKLVKEFPLPGSPIFEPEDTKRHSLSTCFRLGLMMCLALAGNKNLLWAIMALLSELLGLV